MANSRISNNLNRFIGLKYSIHFCLCLVLGFTSVGSSYGQSTNPKTTNEPEKFTQDSAFQKATFQRGDTTLSEYFSHHLVYPEEAKIEAISGRVVVRFVVYKDGTVDSSKITIESARIGYGLEEEAIRVVLSTSGMWKPATMYGRPVPSMYTIPVAFELHDPPDLFRKKRK